MWRSRRTDDDFQRQLEELRNRVLSLETKLSRVEDQMAVWPTIMEDLGEKARTVIRRLSKRVQDAERQTDSELPSSPAPDQITALIRQRRGS